MTVFIFLVLWVAITLFLGVLGMRSFADSLLLAFTPAALAAAWLHMRRALPKDHLYTAKGQEPLRATYAAENIALDVPNGRLWARDVSGRALIVDLAEIAAWEHVWVDTSNGVGKRFRIRNELVIRLRQLDDPMVRVAFRRHNDAFLGNKNHEEAAAWQARLTNLING
ncbi:MAG: hypothetical protein ACTHOL_18595 [Luteibacter jiangsuensis]